MLALLAGCGGSSASFAVRADALCLKRERATAALPAPSSPTQVAALFDRQQRLVEDELGQLEALDPPKGGDALAALVAEIRAELDAAGELRIASLIGDPQSAQGAIFRGRKAARRAHVYAKQLGLTVCGRA